MNVLVTIDDCMSKCMEMMPNPEKSFYFIHGIGCQGPKCECQCNTKQECEQQGAKWNLYKYSEKGNITEDHII